jgi:methylenetetrahydrofolate reductase (NADPH)
MNQSESALMDGDTTGHPASGLETLLRARTFVVTSETTPPLSASPEEMLSRVAPLAGIADAVNVTDGAGARPHMATLAATALMARDGIEPVLQFTMRDRNRLALQADLLGAGALGIANILCLHGDDITQGDQPDAKPVWDLDSRGFIATARAMRDEAILPSGREIKGPPRLFIGAADTPRDPDDTWSADGLRAKIDAGAQFFQTQYCFDPAVVGRYMARLGDAGILDHASFIVGIGPIRSAKSARWMNENLWGVHIPDPIIARIEGADDEAEEGIRICADLIEALADIPGVGGAHVMGPRSEAASAEAIKRSGILKSR